MTARRILTVAVAARARRALAALTLALLAFALAGCAAGTMRRPAGAPAAGSAGAAPARTERSPWAEAREQSSAHPREPYWPFRLAELRVDADSLPAAEASLRASLARDPAYAPALALLSKLYYDAGRHQEAVALLEPVRTQPGAFEPGARQVLLAGLALHLDALGRPDLAGAALREAPAPDLKRAGSAVVYLMLRGDRPDSAGELAGAALREDSRSAANQNNYGIARLRAGDPREARKAFLAAIDRDPGPYYNLAILAKYYLLDDQDASRWFAAYWQRSHADPDSLYGVFTAGPQKALVEKGN
jgi:tetratricopeptide (TPR) repeat protein